MQSDSSLGQTELWEPFKKCTWCTIVLQTTITKSVSVRTEFSTKLDAMETACKQSLALNAKAEELKTQEAELNESRKRLWVLRERVLEETGGATGLSLS